MTTYTIRNGLLYGDSIPEDGEGECPVCDGDGGRYVPTPGRHPDSEREDGVVCPTCEGEGVIQPTVEIAIRRHPCPDHGTEYIRVTVDRDGDTWADCTACESRREERA